MRPKFKKFLKPEYQRYLLFFPTSGMLLSILFLVYLSGLFVALLTHNTVSKVSSNTHYVVEEVKRKDEITKVEKVISQIIEEESNNTEKWDFYSNSIYGYSFKYPKGLNVRELPFRECEGDKCKKKGDVAVIGALNISAYHSTEKLSLAYSRGLDKYSYLEPIETNIGGVRFYYIVTQYGKVERIVHDYKYLDGLLWIKDEYKVEKGDSSYYVSFGKGILPVDVEMKNIDDLNKVLNTFEF